MYRIHLVCEGLTDLEVFGAVLDAHLGGKEYQLTMLQPDGSLFGGAAGPHGGGWKGVRGWCRAAADAGGIEAVGALGSSVNLLVIHVDADIAYDGEHDASQPCPPPARTVQAVETIVMAWLGVDALPARVVLWIPCMATEAWIMRVLFSTLPESESCLDAPISATCVECLPDPARILLGKTPKLIREKRRRLEDGRKVRELKKVRSVYAQHRSHMSAGWAGLTESVWSATHLAQGLSQWIP